MTQQQLKDAIARRAVDGKVNCKVLLELAQEAGASPKLIAALCDEMDIRISNCQLGCFH